MKPTLSQLRFLKLYCECHNTPPTFGRLLRRNIVPLVIFGGIIAAGLFLALTRTDVWFGIGCFATGLGVGALARVVRQLACSLRVWPVIDEVVDWTKVDTLVGGRPSK